MNNLSLTQVGNYTAFIPVIILVLKQFNIIVSADEITNIITALMAVGGILVSIYGRYRQGDVNLLGKKTEELG